MRIALALALIAPPGCKSEEPVAGHPSGLLDFACEELPAGAQPAPEPWVVVSPEFEAYVAWLADSPFRDGGHETLVDDLTAFEGALYVGLGDHGFNPGSRFCPADGGACPHEDAPGHGIPMYRFDPGAQQAVWDHVLREEEIAGFRRTGHALLVPGRDPTEGDGPPPCAAVGAEPYCPIEAARAHPRFEVGAFHMLQGGRWTDRPVLEAGIHVFDHAVVDGRIYAAGSAEPFERGQSGFATVWASDDNGASFRIDFTDDDAEGYRRLSAIVPLDGVLLGLGYHKERAFPVRFARPEGGSWAAVDDLAPLLGGPTGAELVAENLALAWSVETGAAYALRGEGGAVAATRVLEGHHVLDAHLVCAGDLLVLSATPKGAITRYTVHRSPDLADFEVVLTFDEATRIASVAAWEGRLVFGAAGGWLYR